MNARRRASSNMNESYVKSHQHVLDLCQSVPDDGPERPQLGASERTGSRNPVKRRFVISSVRSYRLVNRETR